MQATIYVSEEAFATANAIKDLNYHDRMSLSDDEATDLSKKEGYYLKNANRLKLAVLPPDALVSRRLVPEDDALYRTHVSFPTNLRGCIFENAPNLPDGYAGIVTYWSGPPVNASSSGAAYFQNPQNEYMIDLSAMHAANNSDEIGTAPIDMDDLLSEGVVVSLTGLEALIRSLPMDSYIEVKVPASQSMLGIEPDDFRSVKPYTADNTQQCEQIFIKVGDILRHAPDRDRIYIDLIRTDLIDYGYWY